MSLKIHVGEIWAYENNIYVKILKTDAVDVYFQYIGTPGYKVSEANSYNDFISRFEFYKEASDEDIIREIIE